VPLSVLLFEPDLNSRRRMLPFVALGLGTTLYILWALTAYSFQVYIKQNSIVYTNQGTSNIATGVLYVVATCGSLFFSKVRPMVMFGAANLAILLIVLAFKEYAYTSLWCAYAAIASVIILAYFWKSSKLRPLIYVKPLWARI
jgi:FtsH-binding integral membrane protein